MIESILEGILTNSISKFISPFLESPLNDLQTEGRTDNIESSSKSHVIKSSSKSENIESSNISLKFYNLKLSSRLVQKILKISFRSGFIEKLEISIPNSIEKLLKESVNIKVSGLHVVLENLPLSSSSESPDAKSQTASSSMHSDIKKNMSSSFQFNQEFMQSEYDDYEDQLFNDAQDPSSDQQPEGLKDLANLAETVIGKASIIISDISLTFFNTESKHSLVLKVNELKLKDHITNNLDIPTELLDLENDIFSILVKYVVLSDLTLAFHQDENSKIILLSIPITWARFLFSQQDNSKPPLSSSETEALAESLMLSDFQLKTFAYGAVSMLNLSDLERIGQVIQNHSLGNTPSTPQSPNFSPMTNSSIPSSPPPSSVPQQKAATFQFLLHFNSISFVLVPISCPSPYWEFYESFLSCDTPVDKADSFWSRPHLEIIADTVQFSKGISGTIKASCKRLEIKEYRNDNYNVIFTLWSGVDSNVEEFVLFVMDSSASWNIDTGPLLIHLGYNQMKTFKDYFVTNKKEHSSSVKKASNTTFPSPSINITVPAIRIHMDLDLEDQRAPFSLFMDATRLRIFCDSLDDWNVTAQMVALGFIESNPSLQSSLPFLKLENLMVTVHTTEGFGGLSEDIIRFRHDSCRKSAALDSVSTKSWSDLEEESESVKPEEKTSTRPTKYDLLEPAFLDSKYFVKVLASDTKLQVDVRQTQHLMWLGDFIQRLNAKSPPEPTQFPITILFSIKKVWASLTESAKTYAAFANDMDLIVSVNSSDMTKNIVMVDLFCGELELQCPIPSSNVKWKLLNSAATSKYAMAHVVFSQTDDLELELRQMKLSACLNDAFLHIPQEKPSFPSFEPIPKSGEVTNTNFSSSLDLFIAFSDSAVSVSNRSAPTGIAHFDSFKVTSNIITDSPTNGYAFDLINSTLYLGVNPLLPSLLQNPVKSGNSIHDRLQKLNCASVVDLDSIHIEIRTNQPGVYPTHDYSISFNQLIFETCKDSKVAFLEFIASLTAGGDDKVESSGPSLNTQPNLHTLPKAVDTFDLIDEGAFKTQVVSDALPEDGGYDLQMEELEDELEWNMDFESTLSKEEVLVDKIEIFPCATTFSLNQDYLGQLKPINEGEISQVPQIQICITEGNISWRLYPESDFDLDKSDRDSFYVEVHFLKIFFSAQFFPSNTEITKRLELKIRDIEIFDRIPESKFQKFFSYQASDNTAPPRQTESDMLSLVYSGIRAEKEELRLKLNILPIQLHIDQDLVLFLESFFKDDGAGKEKEKTKSVKDESFFQYCEISPMSFLVDYKPKHVNYSSIKQGELAELINLIHLDEARIYLKGIKLAGVQGWHSLINRIISIWLPHIRNTQLPQMASGISGMKSIVNIGGGLADFVLLPIEQYQKDGRLIKGISRGTKSFLKATTKEAVRFSSKLASGAQVLIENAETKSRSQVQDQVSPQTVPAALLKPLVKLTGVLADNLVTLSDSINGVRTSSSKYK